MAAFQWVKHQTPLSEVSPSFILPDELRPKLSQASALTSIPVIDLTEVQGKGLFAPSLVEKVSRACEEYGFFQIINHGVSDEVCARMFEAMKQLFEMPPHVKAELFSEDPRKEVRLFSRHLNSPAAAGSSLQPQDHKVSMWSEAFYHPWSPFLDFIPLLQSTPSQYREVIGEYVEEISNLLRRLLSLISIGLGLEKDYLERRHGKSPRRRAQGNYYPPCPDPELVLGLATHTDLNTLTILQQWGDVSGLQVIKGDKWVCVNPVPKSFVINVGDQLQVLSNGRYKSVHHRAVANKHQLRMSMAMFFGPDEEAMVGPIEELVDEEHPPLYRSYRYKDFVQEFHRQDGTRRRVKEAFELQR